MTFTFGNINVASKKRAINLRMVDNMILVDKSNSYASYPFTVIVLADEPYTPSQLKNICIFLEKNRITKYKIISAINVYMTKDSIREDQKVGVVEFYRNNAFDFIDELGDGNPVITVGGALYALTQSDDIYPDHVRQRIFGKNYFWFSRTLTSKGNWIYPIDSFRDIFAFGFGANPVDSFKTRLAEFQFKSIISRKTKHFSLRYPKINRIYINSEEEFFSHVFKCNSDRRGEILVYDLETSGFDFLKDEIGCISLTFDGVTGYYVPWKYVNKEQLSTLFENNKLAGANLKFDNKFLMREGIRGLVIDHDVVALGHTLDETRSNSLKSLAYFYSEFGGYERELDEYIRLTKVDNYLEIPEDILKKYALMDAIVTYRVLMNLIDHIHYLDERYPNEYNNGNTMYDYYKHVKIPATNLYQKFEYHGVYIDIDKMNKAQQTLENRLEEIQIELTTLFKVPINYDFSSNKSLSNLLKERGWEPLGFSKNGDYSTADEQLERWAKDHKEAELLREMRSLNTLRNTFIGDAEGTKGWRRHLKYHPEDNSYRLHASYNAMGTESGRTRCSEPNMMNIPSRGKFADEIKKFISTPNNDEYYLMTIDYSALQLRLAGADGDDPVLFKVFSSKNADVHSATAYNSFFRGKKIDVMEVEVEQDGVQYHFLGGELVTTQRGEVLAKDLLETDVLQTN